MFNVIFIGLDGFVDRQLDATASQQLAAALHQAYPAARVIGVPVGDDTQGRLLGATLGDLGVPFTTVGVHDSADVWRVIGADGQLTGLLDQAGEVTVIGGLCDSRLQAALELTVAAARLGGVIRRTVVHGAEVVRLDAPQPLPALRVRTPMAFREALGVATDLIDDGDTIAARAVLRAVTDVAREAADAVFFALPGPLELLDLSIRCRRVPSAGIGCTGLADDLTSVVDDVSPQAVAVVAALGAGDGEIGAAALAAHARQAAALRGDEPRSAELATIASALPPAPSELIAASADVAQQLAVAARNRLRAAVMPKDESTSRKILVVVAETPPAALLDRLRVLPPADRIMVAGPRAAVDAISLAVQSGGASDVVDVGEVGDLAATGAADAWLLPGDRVTVVTTGAVSSSVAAAFFCMSRRAHVELLWSDGARMRVSAVVDPIRQATAARLIARRLARTSSLSALAALRARVPDAVDARAFATAVHLAAEAPQPARALSDLGALGVPDGLLTAAAARLRLDGPASSLVRQWPRIRRLLVGSHPEGPRLLISALASEPAVAALVAAGCARAHAGGRDAQLADVGAGLGLQGEADELLDELEETLARHLAVDVNLLGGADLVVSALNAVAYPGASAGAPSGPAAVVIARGDEPPPSLEQFREITPPARSPAEERALRRLALAELRREVRPQGMWAIDSALARVELEAAAPGAGLTRAWALAGTALERLISIPGEVLTRGGFELRAELLADLWPLREFLDGTPTAAEYDRWRTAWTEDLLFSAEPIEVSAGVDVLAHLPAGDVQLPVGLSLVEAGLAAPEAKASVAGHPPGVVSMRLDQRVERAAQAAADAWSSAGSQEVQTVETDRALLYLRALLFGQAADLWRRWWFEGPRLPELQARSLLDAGEAPVPLVSSGGQGLTSLTPVSGFPLIEMQAEDQIPRRMLARALSTPPVFRAHAAAELRYAAEHLADRRDRVALLQCAHVLQTSEPSRSESALARQIAVDLLALDEAPWGSGLEGLDSTALELTDLIWSERARAGAEVARGLAPTTFEGLEQGTRIDRLSKHRATGDLLDRLDALLI